MKDTVQAPPTDQEIVRVLIAAAAKVFHLPVSVIRYGQSSRACDARRPVIVFLRDTLGMDWKRMEYVMRYDHSTLHHHWRKHYQLIETDVEYRRRFDAFMEIISTKTKEDEDGTHRA